jgi:hypothetical protein
MVLTRSLAEDAAYDQIDAEWLDLAETNPNDVAPADQPKSIHALASMLQGSSQHIWGHDARSAASGEGRN